MPKEGRGGKRGGGGGGGPKNWSKTPNPYQIPATLDEAIGAKGAEKNMATVAYDANPFYSDTYAEFSENCQRVVMAVEMGCRGYDVEALPTYENDPYPRGGNWAQALDGMTRVNVGRTTERATLNAIESQMKSWGEGSRAILRLKWAGGNSGHVINVEYKNGRLHVHDAQDKTRTTGVQYLKDKLPYTTLRRTELFRTDNATPTDTMRYMVKPKNK